ncbi:sugar ABC transporter permease [Candidatus Atribacteria bacterium HGW-Atribacteria-1]|nr:MAG: sugar ABC transporter permease [Candidatus Atribacteria bacterium HGW-Atribacteria-1]
MIKNKTLRDSINFSSFLLPAFILYSIFFLFPLFSGVLYSFTRWNGISFSKEFIGIENFKEIFSDNRFLDSLFFTFKYAVLNVIFINILAFALALMLDRTVKGIGFLRSIFFMPNVISMVIVGFIWQFIFMNVVGEMSRFMGMPFLNQSWLGDPHIALYSVTLVSVWRGTGYMMIIYLAGLQTINSEIIDASRIDGASNWGKFIYIILPLMIPSINICLFMTIANSFKMFDLVFAMTRGGPGYATEVISLNLYNEAFLNDRYGYGIAKAVVLAIIIMIVTYIQLKVLKKREVVL